MSRPRSDDVQRLRAAVEAVLVDDHQCQVTTRVRRSIAIATVRDSVASPRCSSHQAWLTRVHRRHAVVTTHPEIAPTNSSEWTRDPTHVRLITPRERLERVLRFHFTAQVSALDHWGAPVSAPDDEDDPRMPDEYALNHFVLTTPSAMRAAAKRVYGSVPPAEAYTQAVNADQYNEWHIRHEDTDVHVTYHGSQEPGSTAALRWAPEPVPH